MRKFLSMVLAILLLCSCSFDEKTEEVKNNPESNVSEEKEVLEIFKSENGKFGLLRGEEIIAEAIYDSIEPAEGDEALFYSYKAFVHGGTKLFLEKGGEHFFNVSERPAERFYLLDKDGKRIIDTAFEEIECHYSIDENNNFLPYYFESVSEGRYCKYDFFDGDPSLIEYVGTEDSETDFGYTVTQYSYSLADFTKSGVKFGEKVIVENIADKIEIPLEDRIIIYSGAVWQAFECGRCLLLDGEGKVLSDKFNRIEFVTFDGGSYIGIAFTAGSVAEAPTFDEKGEQMPTGVWFIDKDGNILSENLFDADKLINYYTLEEDSVTIYCRDYDGNESRMDIPFEGYIIE